MVRLAAKRCRMFACCWSVLVVNGGCGRSLRSFRSTFATTNGTPLSASTAADAVVEALKGVPFVVAKVERKERKDRPHPPFTTSTLQQQANIRHRFAASRTMQTAQKLYEVVELHGMG